MRQRAQAMLERVSIEARAALGEHDAAIVRAALAESLAFRDARIDDDHDPRYLHNARTIRIMIADGECRSVDALAVAAFVDTLDPALTPPPYPGASGTAMQPRAAAPLHALAAAVPQPRTAGDELLERLVTADRDVCLLAIAERLDHARHLHLRTDPPWRPFHEEIRGAYIPAARRCSALIARRLERWADAFERRLILPL